MTDLYHFYRHSGKHKSASRATFTTFLAYFHVIDMEKILFIVGCKKGRGVFRTITARDMTEREKSMYRRR